MKLNIFIDGTWLFNVCNPGGVLASKTIFPASKFDINFNKLNQAILRHLNNNKISCSDFGELILSTSIFDIPPDIDMWPTIHPGMTIKHVGKVKRTVSYRTDFSNKALSAGYNPNTIYKPQLKPYHLYNIINDEHQEKQVDATVVALLVKSAIVSSYEKRDEFHAVITGDSDIIPAIQAAYPQFTKNVLVVTTRPDNIRQDWRQSSFSLSNVTTEVPVLYLQDIVNEIMAGNFVYTCENCNKVFSNRNPKRSITAYCPLCRAQVT